MVVPQFIWLLICDSVWQQILSVVRELRRIFNDSKTEQALKKFILKLVSPAAESLGWEPSTGESYLQASIRPSLLLSAAGAGHQPYHLYHCPEHTDSW